MKIQTLERYIKRTAIPYGDLLERAKRGGLEVIELDQDGTVEVKAQDGKRMVLFFENRDVYAQNKDNGLIKTIYNYSK